MPVPYELHLALRYLRFHRGSAFLSIITFISVAGVMVGVAALVIALSLMAGFVADVRERIHSGTAHLTVLDGHGEEIFPGAPELVQRLEAAEGVQAAAAVLYTPALLSFEEIGSHGFAEVHGVDPATHTRVIPPGRDADGAFERLEQTTPSGRDPIVLGRQLALKLGVLRGDPVRVLIPRVGLAPWGAYPRSRVYELVGTYRSSHFQEDSLRAYVSLNAARALLRTEQGSSWIEVRIDDVRRLDRMRERLREAFAPDWVVVDLIEQNQDILKALKTERLVLFLAIGLIVVVAALNIVSTLILMVTDKIREIGTLTAMGARPGAIARIFMLQGLIIGSVGTVLGLTIGALACWTLERYELLPLDPNVYFIDHIPFRIGAGELVFVGIAALAVSFLATIYPAWKAASLRPVEALRYE